MPELAEKLTAEQHGTLGEQDRTLYVKGSEENTFVLHPAIVAERTALKNKNAQILAEKQQKADALKPFEGLGMDAEKIKEIVAAHTKAEESKLTEKEREEAKINSLRAAHTTELTAVKNAAQEREQFLTKQLRSHMINAVASLAIEKAGVIEGGVEALLPHVISAMDMLEEGDGDDKKFVTRVVDGTKAPRYSGADFMTVDQLVEEFKKKPGFMGLFKASGKGGSGAPANQNNRTTTTRSAADMNPTDKIAAGLAARK